MKSKFKIDFIGIGATKAGTTWVSECLGAHPQIDVAYAKEVHFFNNNEAGLYYRNMPRNYVRGIRWYEKQFPKRKSNVILGEFTPSYMYDKDAAQLIYKHFPNVKLLVCIRDPVDRAYSNYWFQRTFTMLEDTETFEEAFKNTPEYFQRSCYYEPLKRFYDLFPPERIHVVLFDDIVNCPDKVVEDLYSFLEVARTCKPPILCKKSNSAMHTKSPIFTKVRLITLLMGKCHMESMLTLFKRMGIYGFALSLYKKYATRDFKYPKLSVEAKNRLKPLFKKDLKRLEKLIGKDLSHWM